MRYFVPIICLLAIIAPCAAQPNVTTYAQMTAQLQSDAAHSPGLRLVSLGKAAGGRKDIWLIRLADPKADPARTVRVLVLCRQHGDEPASTEAMLSLIHRIAQGGDSALRAALPAVTLYLVPMVNPTGAEAGTRQNSAGADLNRDWGVFAQPETRAVARAARLIRPELVVDAHNWDVGDPYNADSMEIARDVQTPQGKWEHRWQQETIKQLARCGYSVHPTAYGADSDPHLAHRYFSHLGLFACLVETHSGSPQNAAEFAQRQGMYTALIHDLARRESAGGDPERQRLAALTEQSPGGVDTQEAQLFAPSPTAPRAADELPSPALPLRLWLWPLGLYGLSLGLAALGRASRGWRDPAPTKTEGTSYYSLTRKRDGTETGARSGQRNAVSIPPR